MKYSLSSFETEDHSQPDPVACAEVKSVQAGSNPRNDGPMRFARATPMPSNLSDAEVDDICAGLRQNAAKVRYLRDVLKVRVQRKPNGRPLVLRSDWERRNQSAQNGGIGGPKWSKTA